MAAKHSIPLTAERLRELFHYAPETGVFTRRRAIAATKTNDVAGWLNAIGYWFIGIDHRQHLAHRLAWLYVHGAWPVNDIDHIDGNRANNRIDNLREATRGENLQNQRRAACTNRSSGLLGAYWHKANSKWYAKIQVRGKTIYLGMFDTKEAAHAEYLLAKNRLHPFGMLT